MILFIGHDASRSGAPLVLLAFMRWLKQHTDWTLKLLLLRRGGELEADYRDVAGVETFGGVQGFAEGWSRAARYLTHLFGRSHDGRRERITDQQRAELVYLNSVASIGCLPQLPDKQVPVLLHVHESEIGLARYGRSRWSEVAGRVSRYIACSHTTAACLQQDYDVDVGRIDVMPSPLLALGASGTTPQLESIDRMRVQLGIPDNSFVIGGCGTQYWRKGMDLFAQVCQLVGRQEEQAMHFVWIGGAEAGGERLWLDHDVRKRGLSDRFHVVPDCDDPLSVMQCFDVFCMTSRDEAFGMVNVEAAYLKVPVVYFDGTGGPAEILGDEAGVMVPYGDVVAMADAVAQLLGDAELRRRYGEAGHRRVMERYRPDVVFPRMQAVLQRVMDEAESEAG